MQTFVGLCEAGKLYAFLQEKAGLDGMSKRDFKSEHFFESFYGKNYPGQPVWRVIKSEFPTVADYIARAKRPGQLTKRKKSRKTGKLEERDWSHAVLPRKAQRIEAEFIIDTCRERIKNEYPDMFIATIHDSIVTTRRDADSALTVMREEFAKLDVSPRLKIEGL